MTAGMRCFERLQVIQDDVPRSGALNMALDEVLLNGSSGLATLRFYRWMRPTVSFGYFEPAGSARRVARGRELVRRLTGGGIVEHGGDLTYSLVASRTDAFTSLRSAESYRRIHEAVALALARCGLGSHSHEQPPPKQRDGQQPNACFERPVLHDLIVDGRKVAGGAQRRNRVGLLHQGSIQFEVGRDLPGWDAGVRRELPMALAHVREPRAHTPDEVAAAEALAAAKYATPAWTDRVCSGGVSVAMAEPAARWSVG